LQSDIAFLTGEVILLKTQTPIDSSHDNRLVAVDLATHEVTPLLEAAPDSAGQGKGIVYGGLYCPGSCPGVCLMADADRNVLERIVLTEAGDIEVLPPLAVELRVGLPPIALSPF
jgi:hypothetical protein